MLVCLFMAICGGALYRFRGHASKYKRFFPRPFNQAAFALPYAWIFKGDWLVFCVVWLLTTLGVITGHGRGISLSDPNLIGKPETLEIMTKWLIPYMPVYWYKVLVLSVTGLAITLPAGILTGNPVLALSGHLKGPAYMLGFEIYKLSPKRLKWFTNAKGEVEYYDGVKFLPHHLDTGPEIGEFITGAVLWGILGYCL